MTRITAILHTHNDALRLGRALDSLRPCDEIIVVDHASTDGTPQIAQEHGATVKKGIEGVSPGAHVGDAKNDWVLCLQPSESLSEALEACLFEWKHSDHAQRDSFCFPVREENASGWRMSPPETRLVNRNSVNWTGELPAADPNSQCLNGYLLRFSTP
jgi:glycosyltransferase involved in cell wall biosynthesis